MTCSFCGTRNSDSETRCRRCGRKPNDTLRDPYYSTQGALATTPKPEPFLAEPLASASRPMPATAVQRSLFPEQAPKIIPIAAYQPARTKQPGKGRTKSVRVSRRVETQAELDFLPSASGPKKLSTTVDAVIRCEAHVATRLHRGVACVFDLSLIVIGYSLFVLAYALAGGPIPQDRTALLMLGAGLPLVAFAYGLTWAVALTETPGQKWVHLKLITFVGFEPEPKQRILRFLGTCLGACTCGLGFLWAAADEERLSWQDHISRTFVTPSDADTAVFRRV
jgi:uncharacterized RDD family membrane protein YckC